jgi:hypothetical protein
VSKPQTTSWQNSLVTSSAVHITAVQIHRQRRRVLMVVLTVVLPVLLMVLVTVTMVLLVLLMVEMMLIVLIVLAVQSVVDKACCGTVLTLEGEFTREDAIGSDACWLEASVRVIQYQASRASTF